MGIRSSSKGPFVDIKLLAKVNDANISNDYKVIKTWSRKSTILPSFVGRTISVHNGKDFISVIIVEQMVGKKLGEFAPTRKFRGHTNNKK